MTTQKRLVVFLVAGGTCLAALAALWSLRVQFIGAARADLQARGHYKIDINGMRIPCNGLFDVGIAAVVWKSERGEATVGRLCRPLDGSSEWTWYPKPG